MSRVAGWPPRWLTPVPQAAVRASRGPEVIEFIDSFCRVTKDSLGGRAGQPIELRGWQQLLLKYLLAQRPDGRLRHRQALVGLGRKNGKSSLSAGIALDWLMFGPPGSEVYSCAGDRDQARIVFGTARRMVELEPTLGDRLKLYRDVIEHPEIGSVYRVLSAEAYSKEGLNPNLVAWWEPRNPNADFRDPKTWRQANPGYGDLVGAEDFEATVLRTPEPEFRMKRCNQFRSGLQPWLPQGAWSRCAAPHIEIEPGAEIVAAFDGSHNADATAVILATCAEVPHLAIGGLWERPADALPGWCVPVGDVEAQLREIAARCYVREIAADPFRWQRSLQILAEEGLPISEFPQTPARMGPATAAFFEAVMGRRLTHSGDARLARHIHAAVLKIDSRDRESLKTASILGGGSTWRSRR